LTLHIDIIDIDYYAITLLIIITPLLSDIADAIIDTP
jgi:hypothetical protein